MKKPGSVEEARFDAGAPLSPEVAATLDAVVDAVIAELRGAPTDRRDGPA
jgi:hypothetical protein